MRPLELLGVANGAGPRGEETSRAENRREVDEHVATAGRPALHLLRALDDSVLVVVSLRAERGLAGEGPQLAIEHTRNVRLCLLHIEAEAPQSPRQRSSTRSRATVRLGAALVNSTPFEPKISLNLPGTGPRASDPLDGSRESARPIQSRLPRPARHEHASS